MGRDGLSIRNPESGFSIKAGDITGEMIYDAAESGNKHFEEDIKQAGTIFGLHLRWKF